MSGFFLPFAADSLCFVHHILMPGSIIIYFHWTWFDLAALCTGKMRTGCVQEQCVW